MRRGMGTKILAILGLLVILSMILSMVILPSLPSP